MSTAFPINIRSFFGMLLSIFMLLLSFVQTPNSPKNIEMPTTPDDFTPSIRFIVFTDSHNKNDRVKDMIETSYAMYDNDEKYAGIDVVCFCGDSTSVGSNYDMDRFKAALDESIREGTERVIILGNHELKNIDSKEYYKEIYGVDPDRHITVNGFHFIGLSNYYENVYTAGTACWAKTELEKAIADTPDLPVFTFQHPHNTATVYGSGFWATPMYNSVWEGNPQVVNFSGHSHFPINDPRSIWQGTYTALGCGGMDRFELEKDLVVGQHPEGYENAAQFYIVEADNDGSVHILCYDLNTDTVFNEYYIEDVKDTSTYAYTYKNRIAYDDAPVFADGATATLEKNEDGTFTLTIDKAYDKFIVHDYRVKILAPGGVVLYSKTLLSDYHIINDNKQITYNLGKLAVVDGIHYKLQITATNAYYELSKPLTVDFTL